MVKRWNNFDITTLKTVVFPILIFFYLGMSSCSVFSSGSPISNMAYNSQMSEADSQKIKYYVIKREKRCGEHLEKFLSMGSCNKLFYLKEGQRRSGDVNFHLNSYCSTSIITYLEVTTSLKSHANKGYAGIYHDSDSTLNLDLKQWGDYYGCNLDSLLIEE